MAGLQLFGNHITPACKYCTESFPNPGGKGFLCMRGGIVDANHKCRHFYYDPLMRIPKPPIPLEKYDDADFSID